MRTNINRGNIACVLAPYKIKDAKNDELIVVAMMNTHIP